MLLVLDICAQNLEQKLKALPNLRRPRQYYGYSVSISGNYAIMGGYGDSRDTAGNNIMSTSGAACIYERDVNGNWKFKQKIVAQDREADDVFGFDVAISGNYAIVSAFSDGHDATGGAFMQSAGSAYIFERNSSGIWVQVQKIVASDRGADDIFGVSVAISGDYAIVGAKHEDHNASGFFPLTDAGSAYIFERNSSGVWQQVKKIVPSDRAAGDNFGNDVSINGKVAVIGAHYEDHDAFGNNPKSKAGSAYVFERDVNGSWTQVKKIVASDRDVDDLFGTSVSVDGNIIMVGARTEDHDVAGNKKMENAGAVYVCEKKAGTWSQVQKIVASDRKPFSIFGNVSLSGNFAVVSAYYESMDANQSDSVHRAGAAYLFKRNTQTGVWSQVQKFTGQHRREYSYFGWDIAMSGNHVIVGAQADDLDANGTDSLEYAGAGYIFFNCVGSLTQISPVACRKYTSPKGKLYTNSAVFNDSFVNKDGCDSIIQVMLTVVNIDKTIIQDSAELSAKETGAGITYQWIDCNNANVPIQGADSRVQKFTKNGRYAVVIEKNGCFDTSACYEVNTLWLETVEANDKFMVSPNPGSGVFEIGCRENSVIYSINVFDACGRIVFRWNGTEEKAMHLDITAQAPGLYMAEIRGGIYVSRVKLVKE